jgi:hypothetical protein
MRRNALMFDFRERRRSYGRLTLSLVFVLGAAAGFAGGHWLSGELGEQAARQAAYGARVELAAAVCADDFLGQQGWRDALAELIAVPWEQRAERVAQQGWASMPDRKQPEKAVARLCAAKLGEAYTSVRRTLPVVDPAR